LHRELYERQGVNFHCNSPITDTASASDLLKEFDAVLLCPGAPVPNYGSIPNNFRRHPSVMNSSDYLDSLKQFGTASPLSPKDKDVIIAGNRDTAADCIGESIRGGARNIFVLDRNPAEHKEYTSHQELRALRRGSVLGNRVIENIEELDTGRIHICLKPNVPSKDDFESETLEGDLLISALGYIGAETTLQDIFQIRMSPTPSRGLLYQADQKSGATDNPKIWVAGDGILGASLLMTAGASGRRAGKNIAATLVR
ncbi:MAG: hypothetical protein KDD60_13060, partial [Bdellovibrionales bacterium]|nr:hypothetical protein [Bdellovibrionales bacterium]